MEHEQITKIMDDLCESMRKISKCSNAYCQYCEIIANQTVIWCYLFDDTLRNTQNCYFITNKANIYFIRMNTYVSELQKLLLYDTQLTVDQIAFLNKIIGYHHTTNQSDDTYDNERYYYYTTYQISNICNHYFDHILKLHKKNIIQLSVCQYNVDIDELKSELDNDHDKYFMKQFVKNFEKHHACRQTISNDMIKSLMNNQYDIEKKLALQQKQIDELTQYLVNFNVNAT